MAPHGNRPTTSHGAPTAPTPRTFSRLSQAAFRRFGEPPPFRAPRTSVGRAPSRLGPLSDPTFRSRLGERTGKVRLGILLWALGVPIPLILLFALMRGCV